MVLVLRNRLFSWPPTSTESHYSVQCHALCVVKWYKGVVTCRGRNFTMLLRVRHRYSTPFWPTIVTKPTLAKSFDPLQDLSWDHAAELYEEVLVAAKYQW